MDAPLTLLDPACGSGSFLIGAYQFLLDWHLNFYTQNNPDQWASSKFPPITQCTASVSPASSEKTGGTAKQSLGVDNNQQTSSTHPPFHSSTNYTLTTAERNRILLAHICGVDIDTQAVEVTKLSLLLKVLEGETSDTLHYQFRLLHERALPDLSQNIKCGNSLIGPDFYQSQPQQLNLFDEDQIYRINAFDWTHEFPHIFKNENPGFNTVIGNPPYGAYFSKIESNYLLNFYNYQNYQLDSYMLFLEKALSFMHTNAFLGFIIPNTWLLNLQTEGIRKYIFSNYNLNNIVHYQRPVFRKATVDTEIIILQNVPSQNTHHINIEIISKTGKCTSYSIPQERWLAENGKPVNIFLRPEIVTLSDKIRNIPMLDDLCIITQGCKPFQVGKGKPPQTREIVNNKPFVSETQIDSTFRPLLRGNLMGKYKILWSNNYWISFGDWLAEPRYSANFDLPSKIVVRQTGDSLVATLDSAQFIVRDNLYTIVPRENNVDLRYILGLINSNLQNWYYQNVINPEKGEALAQIKRGHLARLPIIDPFDITTDKSHHDQMVSLVERMLSLHQKLSAASTPDENNILQRQIDTTDHQIDQLTYQLYNLTKNEIKIVEEST